MDSLYAKTLLFDFYGELLTDHQKAIYEAVVMEDGSLSEVAKEFGISRQGVHDLIRRINKILLDYENKLKLVERFLAIKEKAGRIKDLTDSDTIRSLADDIIEEL